MYEESDILFRLFGLPVYPYALFLALGALIALFMALLRARKTGVSVSAVLTFAMLSLPLSVIFARLIFCVCRPGEIVDAGMSIIWRIDYGGFSLMGAFIGLLLAAILTRSLEHVSFLDLCDTVMPGLLVMLAVARLGEGATTNGIGVDVQIEALRFFPIARLDAYEDYCYAIHMGEALTALCAGVYTQTMSRRARGLVSGLGLIAVAAAQILWEALRRDEVLIFSFVRITQVFVAVVLLVVLILSLRRSGWQKKKVVFASVCMFLGIVIVGMNEFFAESKLISFIPAWLCYSIDAVTVFLMGLMTARALLDACEGARK